MRSTPLFIGSIALLLVGAACQKKTAVTVNQTVQDSNENENVNSTVPSLSNARVDSSANANSSVLANGNVNGNTNSHRNENENRVVPTNTSNDMISVEAPSANAAVSSPVAVTGTTNATAVFVRVKNSAGTALFTESATVKDNNFSINLSFEFSQTTTGTIEVFTRDTSEREADLIAIPVTFAIPTALPDPIGTLPSLENTNNSSY